VLLRSLIDICIHRLTLYDSFGDGWETAFLSLITSIDSHTYKYTLTCGEVMLTREVCFHLDDVVGGTIHVSVVGYNILNKADVSDF
jgi:hypothetical protein